MISFPMFSSTHNIITHVYHVFKNSVDPDQLASKKPADLDLHYFLTLLLKQNAYTMNAVCYLDTNGEECST